MDHTITLPDVEDLRVPGVPPSFCLTSWKTDQLKVTFLPTLVQTAVMNSCRVIVLLEQSGDWPATGVDVPSHANLTVNDVALDVILESEARSRIGGITLTWLRAVDKRTGMPLWEQGDDGGYRCCIIRMSAWERGTPPDLAAWRAFWAMFTSACKRAAEDFKDEELKVLGVDIGAIRRPSGPLHPETEEMREPEPIGLWGVGDRIGFLVLFNELYNKYGYTIPSAIKRMHATSPSPSGYHSPSALKSSNGSSTKGLKSPNSPQRVCFSESDTIVLPEGGNPCGAIKPASHLARTEGAKAAPGKVEGLGLSGNDVMNLFTSIVEQQECTETAAGVIRHLERTDAATKLRDENRNVRKQLAAQKLALRLKERRKQREENASPDLMCADTRIESRVDAEELPLPPGGDAPLALPTPPAIASVYNDSSISVDSQGLSLETECSCETVAEESFVWSEKVSTLHESIENSLRTIANLTSLEGCSNIENWFESVGAALIQEVGVLPSFSSSPSSTMPSPLTRGSICGTSGSETTGEIANQNTSKAKLIKLNKCAYILHCIVERFVAAEKLEVQYDLMISESQYWFLVDAVD